MPEDYDQFRDGLGSVRIVLCTISLGLGTDRSCARPIAWTYQFYIFSRVVILRVDCEASHGLELTSDVAK